MIRTVVFDFDGTLVDSMPRLAEIAAALLNRHYGLAQEFGKHLYVLTSGLPFVEQMERIFPGKKENAAIVKEFEDQKQGEIMNAHLFPESKEVLAALAARGYKVVISSSNFQPLMEEYMRRHGVKADLTLGYQEGFSKGRDHFNFIKAHFQIDTEAIVFVGDSLRDYEKAQENGVQFIGRVGTFTAADFKSAGVKTVIHNLRDLLLIIY